MSEFDEVMRYYVPLETLVSVPRQIHNGRADEVVATSLLARKDTVWVNHYTRAESRKPLTC